MHSNDNEAAIKKIKLTAAEKKQRALDEIDRLAKYVKDLEKKEEQKHFKQINKTIKKHKLSNEQFNTLNEILEILNLEKYSKEEVYMLIEFIRDLNKKLD